MTSEEQRRLKKKEYDKLYYQKNKYRIRTRTKRYKDENPEISRKSQRKYYWNNREMILKKKSKKDKTPEGREMGRRYYYKNRLSCLMSTAIRESLKGNKNGRHWEDLVGYTQEDLRVYLEKLFKPDMTWENHGVRGWHIDHIKPKSSFNITDYECDEFKECWSLKNLQPLWSEENLRKGSKLMEVEN